MLVNSAQYCIACRRKHRADLWYGRDPFRYCGVSYVRMFKAGQIVIHPSWPMYEGAVVDSDATGARICAAGYRLDVLAIREGAVLMSASTLSLPSCMLVSLLASTLYFPWPSQAFILRVTGLKS